MTLAPSSLYEPDNGHFREFPSNVNFLAATPHGRGEGKIEMKRANENQFRKSKIRLDAKHPIEQFGVMLCFFSLLFLSLSCNAQNNEKAEEPGKNNPTAQDFSLIPAGEFKMGRTSGDNHGDAPPVTVNVSAFYMGKYEVTKAEWDEVRTWGASNGYTDLATGAGKASNHPVQTVSWWDVIKWCNARSQKEGLTPVYTVSGAVMKTGTTGPTVDWTANGYRLPTEAEWEKAARGGVSGKRFPSGSDTISHSEANYHAYPSSSYHPTYATGEKPYTSPVGAFAANGYGLHDMAGNVWEWCWDWHGDSTYVNGATDPRGPALGTGRVVRGGCWKSSAGVCRVAYRDYSYFPTITGNDGGFRVARSSVPSTQQERSERNGVAK